MRFLVDEYTGSSVADWLREPAHDVLSIYDEAPRMEDDAVLQKANTERQVQPPNSD